MLEGECFVEVIGGEKGFWDCWIKGQGLYLGAGESRALGRLRKLAELRIGCWLK